MATVEVKKILTLMPELLEIPYSKIWTSYDKEADVLYTTEEPYAGKLHVRFCEGH